MAEVVAGWSLAIAITVPFAIAHDRRLRAGRVGARRRAVVFLLTAAAAPLGVGLWLGLLDRRRTRRTTP